MKTKKLQKKLSLKKETVTNLGREMKDILAGGQTCPSCPTLNITCQTCLGNATCAVECFPERIDTCVSCVYDNGVCLAW